MSRVIITLEDNPEGTVTQTVAYEMADSDGVKGGFDQHSPAHMYSVMMLKAGGEIANESESESAKPANDGDAGIILLS